MKKALAFLLIFTMFLVPTVAFAENEIGDIEIEENEAAPAGEQTSQPTSQRTSSPTKNPNSSASPSPSASASASTLPDASAPEGFDMSIASKMQFMLIDAASGQILLENESTKRVYPASTTKLMTALLLLEKKGLDGEVTAGDEISGFSSASSLMGLIKDEVVSVKDLLYGLLLASGNDAANTIAVHVSGGVDEFIALMNSRAKELGMVDTNFVNTHGAYINQSKEEPVPEETLGKNHYTTVANMATLSYEVAKHPELMEAMGTKTYTLSATNKHEETRDITNSNPLLATPEKREYLAEYLYPGTSGMKTGTVNRIVTDDGEFATYGNVVASAQKDGLSLIALVYGDTSQKEVGDETVNSFERWPVAAQLFDYGFSNFVMVDLNALIVPFAGTEQVNGSQLQVTSQPAPSLGSQMMSTEQVAALAETGIATNVSYNQQLPSSINTGDVIGTVDYTLNGSVIYSTELLAAGSLSANMPSPSASAQPTSNNSSSGNFTFPVWAWFIIVPVAIFLALLIIRFVNLSRRRSRHPHSSTTRRSGTSRTSNTRSSSYNSTRSSSSSSSGYSSISSRDSSGGHISNGTRGSSSGSRNNINSNSNSSSRPSGSASDYYRNGGVTDKHKAANDYYRNGGISKPSSSRSSNRDDDFPRGGGNTGGSYRRKIR